LYRIKSGEATAKTNATRRHEGHEARHEEQKQKRLQFHQDKMHMDSQDGQDRKYEMRFAPFGR
jgi:hypothetical protein